MASAFAHALAAYTLGKVFPVRHRPLRFWLLGMFCAVLPDADVLAFVFGIPYDHVLGHRGLSHSLPFALLLALTVTWLFFRRTPSFTPKWWGLVSYFFGCTVSHAVLDALTTGGLGVAFFAPFTNQRYFFPWRPILVSPIGVGRFFSERGVRVILSEAVWVGVPCLLLLLGTYWVRRRKRTQPR
jgi:inner membrane protein